MTEKHWWNSGKNETVSAKVTEITKTYLQGYAENSDEYSSLSELINDILTDFIVKDVVGAWDE